MSDPKNTAETRGGARPAGRSTSAQDEKRARATRRLIGYLASCLTLWAGIYVANLTGHMSAQLSQYLAAAILVAGSFRAGAWLQFMWPKEG